MSKEEKGGSGGHSCPPHPHTTFPFKVLSLPTPVYFSFHLLEVQAATNPPLRQAPFQRVIGFCDFVIGFCGFCDYQITGFPVHGVNSVAMRLCSKSEEVSFGL